MGAKFSSLQQQFKSTFRIQLRPTIDFCLGAVLLAGSSVVWAQSVESNGAVEKCSRSLGTLAVAEPQNEVLAYLGRYKLGSPSTMLRLIAQDSGCFTVVERGIAMQNLQQERALAAAGQLQGGSNLGAGQLQAADFVMTPAIQFSDDTGGVAGAVGGLLGRMGGVLGSLGGLAGGVRFKEAETNLLLADVRSGIQVASAEGQASKMNFSLGGWGWGGLGWASAGGYSKTPEGKLIAASLLNNFNKIVLSIRDRPQLIQTTSNASRANAAASLKTTSSRDTAQSYTANAPRAAVTAVVPMAAAEPSAVPATLMGLYAVKFTGQDEGTVNVMVTSKGTVNGSGLSTKYNTTFTVSGTINPQGEFTLSGTGKAGGAQFLGNINTQTGAVMGLWQWSGDQPGQGTFTGQKQ
jgi:hypothetical protein